MATMEIIKERRTKMPSLLIKTPRTYLSQGLAIFTAYRQLHHPKEIRAASASQADEATIAKLEAQEVALQKVVNICEEVLRLAMNSGNPSGEQADPAAIDQSFREAALAICDYRTKYPPPSAPPTTRTSKSREPVDLMQTIEAACQSGASAVETLEQTKKDLAIKRKALSFIQSNHTHVNIVSHNRIITDVGKGTCIPFKIEKGATIDIVLYRLRIWHQTEYLDAEHNPKSHARIELSEDSAIRLPSANSHCYEAWPTKDGDQFKRFAALTDRRKEFMYPCSPCKTVEELGQPPFLHVVVDVGPALFTIPSRKPIKETIMFKNMWRLTDEKYIILKGVNGVLRLYSESQWPTVDLSGSTCAIPWQEFFGTDALEQELVESIVTVRFKPLSDRSWAISYEPPTDQPFRKRTASRASHAGSKPPPKPPSSPAPSASTNTSGSQPKSPKPVAQNKTWWLPLGIPSFFKP